MTFVASAFGTLEFEFYIDSARVDVAQDHFIYLMNFVAATLRHICDTDNVVVARLINDEFLVVLAGVRLEVKIVSIPIGLWAGNIVSLGLVNRRGPHFFELTFHALIRLDVELG